MKKILIILLFLFMFIIVGCRETEECNDTFKVSINDDFGIIINKIQDSYSVGTEVEIRIKFFSGVNAEVYIDGDKLSTTPMYTYYEYGRFVMPSHDITIQTKVNGYTLRRENCNDHEYIDGHCIHCGAYEPSILSNSIFANLNTNFGLDIYVAKDNGVDKCIMTPHNDPGLSATVVNIVNDYLKENSVTLSEMKEILLTYNPNDLYFITLKIYESMDYIVSYFVPNVSNERKQEVSDALGLDISTTIKGFIIAPLFSSGVLKAVAWGENIKLGLNISPTTYEYKNVYYKSTDETVFTVTNDGVVSFVGPGSAQLMVSVDGVVVYQPVYVSDLRPRYSLNEALNHVSKIIWISSLHSSILSFVSNVYIIRAISNELLDINFITVEDVNTVIPNFYETGIHATMNIDDNYYLVLDCAEGDHIIISYRDKENTIWMLEARASYEKIEKLLKPILSEYIDDPVVTRYLACELTQEQQEEIVKIYIYQTSDLPKYGAQGVKLSGQIIGYYGTYNGYYAIIATDNMTGAYFLLTEECVDSIVFKYSDSRHIVLINDLEHLTLEEAFERGVLSHDDLLEISRRLNG